MRKGSTASASAWFGDANPGLALHSSRFLHPSRHVRNLFGVHRRRSEKLCSLHSNTIPRSHSFRRNLSRTRPWAAATAPCCVYSSESLLSRQAPTSTCLNPGSSVTTGVARTSNHLAHSIGSTLVFVHGLIEPDLRDLVPVFLLNFLFCRVVSYRYGTSRQHPPPVFASVVFNCIAHPKCCFAFQYNLDCSVKTNSSASTLNKFVGEFFYA